MYGGTFAGSSEIAAIFGSDAHMRCAISAALPWLVKMKARARTDINASSSPRWNRQRSSRVNNSQLRARTSGSQISSCTPRGKRSVKPITFTSAFRRVVSTSGESIDSSKKHASRGTRRLGSASRGLVPDDLLDFFRRAIVFPGHFRDGLASVEPLRNYCRRYSCTPQNWPPEGDARVHFNYEWGLRVALFCYKWKQLHDTFARRTFLYSL
jgi:hypothetical protein